MKDIWYIESDFLAYIIHPNLPWLALVLSEWANHKSKLCDSSTSLKAFFLLKIFLCTISKLILIWTVKDRNPRSLSGIVLPSLLMRLPKHSQILIPDLLETETSILNFLFIYLFVFLFVCLFVCLFTFLFFYRDRFIFFISFATSKAILDTCVQVASRVLKWLKN